MSDTAGKAMGSGELTGKRTSFNGAGGTRATHLRQGYGEAGIDGQTERSQWAGAHESTWAANEWSRRWRAT